MHESIDQYSKSPYKRNPKNKTQHHHLLPHYISENNFQATGGLLQAPPPPYLSHSYPPYSLHRQPPLLPLPAATPRGGVLCFPPAKSNNGNRRSRDSSLTPKKSKSHKKEARNFDSVLVVSSNSNNLGPDPKELPKSVDKVLPFMSSSDNIDGVFSGSAVFTISPPPSSLPLPTFSLRPKLCCKAEAAAGIDTGATDDLRRLLRLR